MGGWCSLARKILVCIDCMRAPAAAGAFLCLLQVDIYFISPCASMEGIVRQPGASATICRLVNRAGFCALLGDGALAAKSAVKP